MDVTGRNRAYSYSHARGRQIIQLIGTTLVTITVAIAIAAAFPDWRWMQMPFHSVVESIGGVIALIVGFALTRFDNLAKNLPGHIWVASALVGMGTLDLFHAVVYPGHSFVWLHSVANFVGGLLFAGVCLPERLLTRNRLIPLYTLLLSTTLGIMTLMESDLIPSIEAAGEFTTAADLLNIIGGIGFVLGAIRFILLARKPQMFLAPVLANHCLLFGISGLLFEFSQLWDAVWWEWHLLRLAAYGFILYYFFGTYRHEQLSYEAELRKLSKAIEYNGESIMITDPKGNIEYVNPSFCSSTGYSRDELIGRSARILNSGAQDASFYREMWNTISKGEAWSGKLVDQRKDGSFYPTLMSISPIFDQQGEITHYVSSQNDMTELQQLEDQFHQAQKMESLGTLVGGIAHDFNNMLAAMDGNIYLAKKNCDQPEEVVERLSNVEALSHRASDMVRQLLAYARKNVVFMKPQPLNPLIEEAFRLTTSIIPDSIDYRFEQADKDMVVRVDTTQLQQILMNLVGNAVDAVKGVEAASIHCNLNRFDADRAFMQRHPRLHSSALARISIRDNGHGIKQENLDKVAEPFFTTKEVGAGSGLGLSMVIGSVQRHGGIMEIESKPECGTTVHIYLPLLESEAETA